MRQSSNVTCGRRPLAFLLVLLWSCSSPTEYELSYTWSPVKITPKIEGAMEIESIIEPYRAKLDSIMGEEIGYAAHDLTSRGDYESPLGTFITELLLNQSIAEFGRHVDVAVMNHHGGLRAPINGGPITLGEVFEVMPFENDVVLLEVPGDTLIEIVRYIGQSGRSMIWPVAFEVTEAGVENIQLNGEGISSDRSYYLSVSDYLANGGGGFGILRPLKRMDVKPVKLRDMIVQEIRQRAARGDSIEAEVANLITVTVQ